MPFLPRVIATDGTVALQNDGWFRIEPGEAGETARRDLSPNARVVMGLWSTSRRFGWLAQHLMHVVSHRLGLLHVGEQVRFSIEPYMPAREYFEKDMKGSLGHYIFWTGKSGTGPAVGP